MPAWITAEAIKSLIRKGLTIGGTWLVAQNVVNQPEVDAVLTASQAFPMDSLAGGILVILSGVWGHLSGNKKQKAMDVSGVK